MDKKPTHRNTSCGNLRRPHRTKTSTVWCRLLLRVAAFLASTYTGKTVYVLCGGKGTAPGCALQGSPKVPGGQERIRYVGPYGELTTVAFVPMSADTGLDKVHPTWAGTYILDACVFFFPTINFALIDSDCVPVTLFEIQDLGQQGHNFSPTWTQLAPTSAQLGCKITQLGPTWSHLGYGFKLGDIASLIHSPQNAQFRWSKKVLKSNFRQYEWMDKQT